MNAYALSMDLFIFRSAQDPRVFAFSREAAGANLPSALGPWSPVGEQVPPIGQDPPNIVFETVETEGFYITRPGQTS